jgi:predicted DNA-binding transcriptional regulator AlpA
VSREDHQTKIYVARNDMTGAERSYEMVAQDRIPYRKPPGSNILRFDLDEILAWTKARANT